MEQQYIIRNSEGEYFLSYMEGSVSDKEDAYYYTSEEISDNLERYSYWLEGCRLIPTVPYKKEKQDEK